MLAAAFLLAATPPSSFAERLWMALPPTKGNVVVSPVSVEACLGLLISAVGPTSKPPLAKAFGVSPSALAAFDLKLQKRLWDVAAGSQATVSNAAFFSERPTAAYAAAAAKGYGAKVERLRPGAAGVDQVNDWASRRTKGRIPQLLARLKPTTHAALVNAVTFDGEWAVSFPSKGTKKADFATPDGARKVDMMRAEKLRVPYAQGPGFRLAQVPYKGGAYRMSVLLPDAGDPARLLRNSAWQTALARAGMRTVDLALPRFTLRSEPDVEKALKTMGLAPLFREIDLRPALPSGGSDHIDEIIHKTFVKVDEKGTEAAAATAVIITKGMNAPMPRPKIVFRVDRPFAFVIHSAVNGEILFEGVVRNP